MACKGEDFLRTASLEQRRLPSETAFKNTVLKDTILKAQSIVLALEGLAGQSLLHTEELHQRGSHLAPGVSLC